MKIAICDDNPSSLDFIYLTVCDEFKKHKSSAKITPFNDSIKLLKDLGKEHYDVFFLDISMPDIDGFKIAEKIRKDSRDAIIIFITSKDELVYDSFNYQPFYFIRKDGSNNIKNNIRKVIEKLLLFNKQNKSLILNAEGINTVVSYMDILYLKSDRHYIEYHLSNDKVIKVRDVMKDKDKEFEEYDFIKIHQRYLVNLKYVQFVDKRREILILKNGERLEISRNHKNFADEKFTDYLRKTI